MTEDEAKGWLAAHVSRETLDRLELYAALLIKWQKTINLIAPSTVPLIGCGNAGCSRTDGSRSEELLRTMVESLEATVFPARLSLQSGREASAMRWSLVEAEPSQSRVLRETAPRWAFGRWFRRASRISPQRPRHWARGFIASCSCGTRIAATCEAWCRVLFKKGLATS